jgi:hypothetical protein
MTSHASAGALRQVAVTDLPPLAYAHGDNHDPALTHPDHFRPVVNSDIGASAKPHGGLWTAPVAEAGPDGTVLRTAWTDWYRDNEYGTDDYAHFLWIRPRPDARVLLIDTLDDLRAIVAAYPAVPARPALDFLRNKYPDWPALAAAGWDAVFLTDDGQWATRLPLYREPELYTWDCATVLWLRPAYTVDQLVEAVAR